MTDEKPKQPWTPGPWEARESGDAFMVDAATGSIAVVFGVERTTNGGITGVAGDEGGANAVLMAAAPAMAEALAALVGATTFTSTDAAVHELDSLDRGEFDSENDFERAKAELAHIVSANRVLDLCGWRRS